MYLQINKEKCFHKSEHRTAHKHYDEEHHDVDVGQDSLHSLHGVTFWKTNVIVDKAEADQRTEQKDIGDHERGNVVNGPRHGGDLVHHQPNKGGHDGGGQGLENNLSPVRAFISGGLLHFTHLYGLGVKDDEYTGNGHCTERPNWWQFYKVCSTT